jgi:hypothetical protein
MPSIAIVRITNRCHILTTDSKWVVALGIEQRWRLKAEDLNMLLVAGVRDEKTFCWPSVSFLADKSEGKGTHKVIYDTMIHFCFIPIYLCFQLSNSVIEIYWK